MRRVLLSLVPAIWLGILGAAQAAVPVQTDWMTVLLGGRKVGHVQIDRERRGDILTTTQTLSLDLSRSGKPMQLGNMSQSLNQAGSATGTQPHAIPSRNAIGSPS